MHFYINQYLCTYSHTFPRGCFHFYFKVSYTLYNWPKGPAGDYPSLHYKGGNLVVEIEPCYLPTPHSKSRQLINFYSNTKKY